MRDQLDDQLKANGLRKEEKEDYIARDIKVEKIEVKEEEEKKLFARPIEEERKRRVTEEEQKRRITEEEQERRETIEEDERREMMERKRKEDVPAVQTTVQEKDKIKYESEVILAKK